MQGNVHSKASQCQKEGADSQGVREHEKRLATVSLSPFSHQVQTRKAALSVTRAGELPTGATELHAQWEVYSLLERPITVQSALYL